MRTAALIATSLVLSIGAVAIGVSFLSASTAPEPVSPEASPAASPGEALPPALRPVDPTKLAEGAVLRIETPPPAGELPRGDNGMPVTPPPAGAELRKEGLPTRPDPLPAAGDPLVWAGRRAEQDATWRTASLAAAEAFCTREGLTTPERDQVLRALTDMHLTLSQIRSEMQTGRTQPTDGRAGMERVRAETRDELVAAIGTARTAALREALDEQVTGGGF